MTKSNIFKPLLNSISLYLSPSECNFIERVYDLAYDAHTGQNRASGEPYITHPVSVALILSELNLDYEAVSAALLHDVIEDTKYTYTDLEVKFGKAIVDIVEGVSKLDRLKFRTREEALAASFQKMILAMTQDPRVILIKFADRIHNMQTLSVMRPEKQRRIAKETFEIYSPIAERLSIYKVKTLLDNLSFKAYYPKRYEILENYLSYQRDSFSFQINEIKSNILRECEKEDISFIIKSNFIDSFSVYTKLKKIKHLSKDILDFHTFHILTEEKDDCYKFLKVIQSMYASKLVSLKDYIQISKTNGYEALHSSIILSNKYHFKIIIQTKYMYNLAQYGVIEYFRAKQDSKFKDIKKTADKWIEEILLLGSASSNSLEFLESIKSDMFSKEIYVFTPKGKIVRLPKGSSVLDFAYALHTKIGSKAFKAIINSDKEVSLSYSLKSGEMVNVLTKKDVNYDISLLSYIKTSKAKIEFRQKIKQTYSIESLTSIGRLKILSSIPKVIYLKYSLEDIKVAFYGLRDNLIFSSHLKDYAINIDVKSILYKYLEDYLDAYLDNIKASLDYENFLNESKTLFQQEVILFGNVRFKNLSSNIFVFINFLNINGIEVLSLKVDQLDNKYLVEFHLKFINSKLKSDLVSKVSNLSDKEVFNYN
ncbi:MAG: HD domain-containing protein [Psittacicella sp.]